MATLTIGVLKKIIENIPEDYEVSFNNGKSSPQVSDRIEVDITLKRLILQKY